MLGRYDDALAEFKRCTELDPDNAEGWAGLAVLLVRLGEGERALSTAEHALRLDAALPRALRAQAEALRTLDRAAEAAEAERHADALETAQRAV
jgi:tetratricopeptide (TPR) repeat protein